jgi:hypothetical protein
VDGPQQLIRARAMRAVSKAIKDGRLLRPEQYFCSDCGGTAAVYDHRDYSRPLDVDPVCQGCNILRGPAKVFLATVEAA